MTTTVRFLNGDLVTYDVPHNQIIQTICAHHPTPIHPFQLVVSEEEEKIMNVLILPRKRVTLDDYNHIRKHKQHLFYDAFCLLKTSSLTNESILSYAFANIPLPKLPVELWKNPHPLVVDAIEQYYLRTPEDVSEAVKRALDTTACSVFREICVCILHNPSDRMMDRLMACPEYVNASCSLWMVNDNPRATQLMFGEFVQKQSEKGIDETYLTALISEIIEHPGVTPEIAARMVGEMSEDSVRILLVRNMNRERAPFVWTELYRRWLTLSPEVRYGNVFIPRDDFTITHLLHTKVYGELLQRFGNTKEWDTYHNINFFRKLATVSDSDEVAEWLLSDECELSRNAKHHTVDLFSHDILSNTHPLLVDWALENETRWKARDFTMNPSPLAVAKTVEWWLDESRKTCFPPWNGGNEEGIWSLLYQLSLPECQSGLRVNLLDILTLLQHTDAEIVFGSWV